VVLCAETYPKSGSKGTPITIGPMPPDVMVFHAGTTHQNEGWVTNGGRILNMVGLGNTHTDAAQKAYQAVNAIRFDAMAYRRDIAQQISQEVFA
jgi:phosphoribosylamine-glycine ligase